MPFAPITLFQLFALLVGGIGQYLVNDTTVGNLFHVGISQLTLGAKAAHTQGEVFLGLWERRGEGMCVGGYRGEVVWVAYGQQIYSQCVYIVNPYI